MKAIFKSGWKGALSAVAAALALACLAASAHAAPAGPPLTSAPEAIDVAAGAATLKATVNPEGAETTYRFQYVTEAGYEADREAGGEGFEGPDALSTPDQTLPEAGYEAADVSASVKTLTPATTYRFRVVAESEDGVDAAEATFATRLAIGIEAQWVSEVAARSATINAKLNPLGAGATWWLEYGPSPCSLGGCARALEGGLPGVSEELTLPIALTGLDPATAYHYRFVATDVREVYEGGETVKRSFTVYGEDQTFATQTASLGDALPDDRAWEMVSPPDKHSGRVGPYEGAPGGRAQAAAGGEALAYPSYGSLQAALEAGQPSGQLSELARRGPGGVWGTHDITPPHTTASLFGAGAGSEYKLFSTDLQSALLEPRDCTALSPQTTERTPYLRADTDPPAYTPLLSAADLPAGTPPFGGQCGEPEGPVSVAGASPDLGHVVLRSEVPLAEGAAPGALYERSAGSLAPLSVLPEGGGAVEAELGSGVASLRGAVSEDGSRVFWTAAAGGLYVRDAAREQTVRLDEEQEGSLGAGEVAPLFQGASAEGSVAFFTDTQMLTPDANEAGADLYRWAAPGSGGCEEAGGCLEDLTAEVHNLGESAEVLGLLPGFDAQEGSSAFFLARGVLATNEGPALDPETGESEQAAPGRPNLYLWREEEGVRFLATLAEADERDWGESPGSLHAAWALSAAASPDGRYLAFMSKLPLSGYDNRAARSGERVPEVFRYDAREDELACVSCNPWGARPLVLTPSPGAGGLSEVLDPNRLWSGVAVAASVPEAAKSTAAGASLYRPRYIHNDGRLFFNAADSLVPADSNGDGDVYEYEPTGVGSCSAAAGDARTTTLPGGCVSLISAGAEGAAAFLDASEGGRDVFFYSPARLSVTDEDRALDVYDAREGGIAARREPAAECRGEACRPPAPETRHRASEALRGPGGATERSIGGSRCRRLARRAEGLSRHARGLRRRARRIARRRAGRAAPRRLRRRAARLAGAASRRSRQARRCQRRLRGKKKGGRAHASVIGGSQAPPGSFPYMALVRFEHGSQSYPCSGTLVSSDVVLTAAHCVMDLSSGTLRGPAGFSVLTREGGRSRGRVSRVSRVAIDPALLWLVPSETPVRADAALLRLSAPVSAPPVRLAREVPAAGTPVLMVGWGRTAPGGELPKAPHSGKALLGDPAYCSSQFDGFDSSALLCAVDPAHRYSTCDGDSGGPLLAAARGGGRPVEVGITSFGEAGCSTEAPQFYTRADYIAPWVSRKIAAWAPRAASLRRAASRPAVAPRRRAGATGNRAHRNSPVPRGSGS